MKMTHREMRTAAIAVGLLVLAGNAPESYAAGKVAPQLPQTVTVLGKPLALKHNADSPSEELVAEYVPAKETLENWTLMLAVRIFKGKLAPEQAVAMKSQEILARRGQGDYMANSASFSKGDLRIIDFVMSELPIVFAA